MLFPPAHGLEPRSLTCFRAGNEAYARRCGGLDECVGDAGGAGQVENTSIALKAFSVAVIFEETKIHCAGL